MAGVGPTDVADRRGAFVLGERQKAAAIGGSTGKLLGLILPGDFPDKLAARLNRQSDGRIGRGLAVQLPSMVAPAEGSRRPAGRREPSTPSTPSRRFRRGRRVDGAIWPTGRRWV